MAIKCGIDIGHTNGKKWLPIANSIKFPVLVLVKKGHIALQDHGDGVWYRNIKIREI